MDRKKQNKLMNIFSEKSMKKNVLVHYGLENAKVSMVKFKNTEKQRAVYKVCYEKHCYCLKKVYFDEPNLLFVYSSLEWLFKSGIKTPTFLNTLSGNKFVKFNDMYFILTIWIDGIKCDFDNLDHLIISSKQLAGIHSCSRNFVPIEGSKKRKGFSDYYISTLKHFNQILTFYNLACETLDDYSIEFLENFEDNLELAKWSLNLSSHINNDNLSKSLCHEDYVNKNIIFDKNSRIWVIDLDKCKLDYSARDVGYFLRRLLRRDNTKFDVELTLTILREYNNIANLTPSDIRYILSYICFPQKFWKLSRDYYKNIEKQDKSLFINLLRKSNKKTYFQLKFIKEISKRIELEYNFKL